MKNRVYGLIGIKGVRSNWNADFTGRPRTTAEGNFFASDKCLKYSDRRYWINENEKVFTFSRINERLNPMTLRETYESIFGSLDDVKSSTDILFNLFSCVDIMNFGVTFAEAGFNFNVTGAVQIQEGTNIYEDSNIETLGILSAFRNPNNKKDGTEKTMVTNGEISIIDKALYMYPFSVNPQNYNEFECLDGFEGYKKEAYDKFKEASRLGATALNTNTKAGCENDFALFIELKDNSKAYLPSLVDYIKYSTSDDRLSKDQYDLSRIKELLENIQNEIKTIEIYYNNYSTEIVFNSYVLNSKINRFNIFTGKNLK